RGDVGQPHEGRGLGEAWRREAVARLGMIGSGHAVTDYTEFRAAGGWRSGTAAGSPPVEGWGGGPDIRSAGARPDDRARAHTQNLCTGRPPPARPLAGEGT